MTSMKELKDVQTFLKDGKQIAKAELEGKYIGFYFSAHWCPPCRGFTPQLVEWYKEFKTNHDRKDDFEIIFVSSDRDEEAFNEYFGDMPWAALPYDQRKVKNKLSSAFKVQGIPTFTIVSPEGELMTKSGRNLVRDDPKGANFPWAPKSLDEMLGDSFRKGKETVGKDALAGKYLALYFSAHWCGPCRSFTPQLIKTYNALTAAGKPFEIVFVSSDRDSDSFEEYYGTMPWLALPYDNRDGKSALSDHFEVEGIPTLVVLDPSGKVVNAGARSAVGADPEGAEFPWAPKPLVELTDATGSNLNDSACLVAFTSGDDKEAEATKAMLQPLAEAEATRAEAAGDDQLFYMYTHDSDMIDSVRDFARLGDTAPLLVIFDIPNQEKYIAKDHALTAENVKAFADSFREGKLEPQKIR
eukprot:UC1_evm2s758